MALRSLTSTWSVRTCRPPCADWHAQRAALRLQYKRLSRMLQTYDPMQQLVLLLMQVTMRVPVLSALT